MRGRGNKANRDKMSILADAKNLLCKLIPMFQRMPKIERMDGNATSGFSYKRLADRKYGLRLRFKIKF